MSVVMSRREMVLGLATGSVVALSGCAYNEALGRKQLMLVSDGDLAQLSASTWKQVKQEERLSSNADYKRRLERVGTKIADATGRSDLAWEFAVFESDQVNAWVLPGGKVGFYTGILDIMENDDQIATVMGHEGGHVVSRHAAERMSQQMLAQGLTMVSAVALAADGKRNNDWIAGALGAGLTFGVILPYSRKHEYEADRLGVDFMHQSGYRPNEALRFWQGMSAAAANRRKPAEFMSTHPSDTSRIAAMRQHISSLTV